MEEEITFYSIKEAIKTCEYTKRKVEYLRQERNKLLLTTDWIFLPDVVIDENKLNAIKQHRQELRDFINKLLNDEIKCRITENDDDFKEKYFPKLILDGTETQKE
jgi:predicted glycosyltransferase